MDPEIIDWENIKSEFVEDEEYENIDAPKWVDLSIPEEFVDDEAWFCKSGCKHPKTAEDFLNSKSFKIKFLRSMTISEFHFFRDKSRRGEKSSSSAKQEFSKSKRLSTNQINSPQNYQKDAENQNPNHTSQQPSCKKKGKCSVEKRQIHGSTEKPSASDQKPVLKHTFSAHNLLKGRGIMSQLMDFCSTLKKVANKRTTKGAGEKVTPAEAKKTAGERRRRLPLQAK